MVGEKRRRQPSYNAAAVCAPGLEKFCAAELKGLGIKPKPAGPGLIEFSANARQLYSANVWLRTATRVVVRVATFRATDFEHLQAHALKIDWSRWLGRDHVPKFRVSTNDSKLYHTKAIAQRLHQVAGPPSTGEPEQLFIVRIERNTVTLSIDSSGQALNHRPWRQDLGEAPLRTTMAAAMIQAANWDPTTELVDPFCGSGTIAIEAALLAANMPSGGDRKFAFQHWPDFDPGSWASVNGTIAANRSCGLEALAARPRLQASDRNDKAVEMAKANADRAGVGDFINFEPVVVSHLKGSSGVGMVITNPPYGKRMGDAKVANLYGRLGSVTRERLPNFGTALVTPDPKLAKAADDLLVSVATFRHGGLPVRLYIRPARPSADEAANSAASTDT